VVWVGSNKDVPVGERDNKDTVQESAGHR